MGPPKKKSSNEVVEDLFKGAKEHGAVPLDRGGPGESSRPKVSQRAALAFSTDVALALIRTTEQTRVHSDTVPAMRSLAGLPECINYPASVSFRCL